MNIFAVDADPAAAARMLCDQHVSKMTLETAQILCTVVNLLGGRAPYRSTHMRHPCVIWAGARGSNYRWLLLHGLALASEFTRRFGGVHASEKVIHWAAKHGPKKRGPRDPFVQAMPEEYRGEDPVEAYRRFYLGEKARFASWRAPAVAPEWWLDSRKRRRYSRKDGQAAPRPPTEAERAGAGAVRRRDAAGGGRGAAHAGAASGRSAGGAGARRRAGAPRRGK